MEPLSVDDAKEVEAAAGGVRADKVKAAQAAAASKKGGSGLSLQQWCSEQRQFC
jgi:hypothetical protein